MKKKVNILLILVVSGLWGTVIYKYISQYLFTKEILYHNNEHTSLSRITIHQKDTFELLPCKRDPFLNTVSSTSSPIIHRTRIKTEAIKPVKNVLKQNDFPKVNYFGYIKSNDKQNELVLLKVNGKLLKLRSNETIENLKVIKIFKDSIRVSYKGEIRNFKKA